GGPHINEPLLLGVVEERLFARELPWQHRPSAALLEPSLPRRWAVLRTYPLRPLNALRQTANVAPGTKLNFARFTFPKYHNQSSRRQYPGMTMPDRNSKPANSRTVLVLDDDVLVRMPVVQLLRECGYRVLEA